MTESAFRLNLEQQRKRAKDLLRAVRAADPAALRRWQTVDPRAQTARLSEAQLIIARELGLPSWPRLKAHIAAMDAARERMASAPDAGLTTLHIRCGSDLKPILAAGGFTGDFLEYSDPFCQGPVMESADWLHQRAAFLGRDYAQGVEQIAAGLEQAEATLHAAADTHERVVLWFEHDSYDQLILARCLACFADRSPKRLELISVDHFPGAMRFIGLGQLPPEAEVVVD